MPRDERWQRSERAAFFTLLAVLLVVLALVVQVFWRFLVDIGLASAMALMLNPAHQRIVRGLSGRSGLSALIITAAVSVVILIPVVLLVVMAASQAHVFYQWVMPQLSSGGLETLWSDTLFKHLGWFDGVRDAGRLNELLTGGLLRLASAINGLLQSAVVDLSSTVLDVVLLVVMLFFFLRDGAHFHAVLRRVSPFSRGEVDNVLEGLASTMHGALASLLVVPLVQGALATLAYRMLGVPNALLWGALTVLVAFIPALGTPLVWGPVCIYLWVQGEIWQSLILAAFGALVLGSVAGVLRPMLLKGSAQIHPLWSLLAVLGGMFAFGALGLLVGPLILSLGLSALSIYEVELLHDRPPAGAERGGQTGETTAEPRSESSEAMT